MADGFISLIAAKRSAIVSKWFDSAVKAYPSDTAVFLKSQTDHFANPVGSNTRRSIETLFDQLVGDLDERAVTESLDPVMRIRAVQSLSPSQATAFLFSLKTILREMFASELKDAGRAGQFAEVERRIDRMALKAFDLYMACREKVYEIKANEARNRTFRAFERAGLVAAPSEAGDKPDAR
jgi:hypothetical protein